MPAHLPGKARDCNVPGWSRAAARRAGSRPICEAAPMAGLAERCLEVLEGSWSAGERDGVRFAYTRPSPGRYRWQWYWDSCFAAIAWRHFDPTRSRRELETLLAAGHLFDERRFWAEVPVPSVA